MYLHLNLIILYFNENFNLLLFREKNYSLFSNFDSEPSFKLSSSSYYYLDFKNFYFLNNQEDVNFEFFYI